jgi:hypothetical protein
MKKRQKQRHLGNQMKDKKIKEDWHTKTKQENKGSLAIKE